MRSHPTPCDGKLVGTRFFSKVCGSEQNGCPVDNWLLDERDINVGKSAGVVATSHVFSYVQNVSIVKGVDPCSRAQIKTCVVGLLWKQCNAAIQTQNPSSTADAGISIAIPFPL
jgi:hypothetical protein